MSYAGVTASGVFTFDERGRFVRMTADRYMGGGETASLNKWEVEARAWKQLGGVLIPVEGSVTWKLKAGDFEYYRWEITALQLNRAALLSIPGTSAPPDLRSLAAPSPAPVASRP
jgi:hypothetical protein